MTTDQKAPSAIALRVWQLGVVFLIACAVIISRRPDAVLNAQFWSEDGRNFFADAYNFGWWPAMFGVHVGYYHTFPRLAAALALLAPFRHAPLVQNVIAISVQALPVVLLLSSRSSVWGSLKYRALMAGIYLALPNCWEIDANITNSQSFLALSAFLILVALVPQNVWVKVFDICVLLLFGLTGPFSIFLAPIVCSLLWADRSRWRVIQSSAIAVGCFVQVWSLATGGIVHRPHYQLGASPAMFAQILAGQIYLGTLFGGVVVGPNLSIGPVLFLYAVASCGTCLVVYCFIKSNVRMRLLLAFAGILFVAPLISPTLQTLNGVTAWETFATGAGNRYWFFPILAFGWTIPWYFRSRIFVVKAASAVLLVIVCFAAAIHWRYPAFPDAHFRMYAKRFDSAPAGTTVNIPQCPPGWILTLVKH